MSDYKAHQPHRIRQNSKGQFAVASLVALCLVAGTGFVSQERANQHLSTHQLTLSPSTQTKLTIAPHRLAQPDNLAQLTHEYNNISNHLSFATDIAQNNIAQHNTLNTTTMLAGHTSSPFASYAQAHQTRPSNQQQAQVASLAEINAFLALKHEHYTYVDNKFFIRNAKKKLPQFKKTFQAAAQQHQLDWRLIAAVAYQESVWNPQAVSPTGVKGLMMLTRITAQEMNVTNRTDSKQSIFGGAGYLAKLIKRIPTEVTGADRILMALSAYNMGYGHLIAARALTARQNADATQWRDVKKRILLLQDKKYYSQSKYGYAHGARQAIHYVAQVQQHFDMLLMLTEKKALEQGRLSSSAINGFALARYNKQSI